MVCWNLSCPAVVKKTSRINSTKSINMLHSWFLMQCCFSQSELSFFLDILKHAGLFLYWSKAALLRKGCNLSAGRICWQLPGTNIGSKQAKAMPESTSISLSASKTPSTAGLLLWWRDGWRLHVLLLPCQCLQWKCGLVIGYINIDA